MTEPLPENLYCKAETEAERLRLRTAVFAAYGGHVRAAARRLVPDRRHAEDAYQEGLVGLLVALGRFDPGRGVPFWAYAALYVRNQIQDWQGRGQHDCKAANRGKAEKYEGRREVVKARRQYQPLDFEPVDGETPERLVSVKEGLRILAEMAAEMTPEEREIFYSEDGRNHRTDHYKSLVAKAAAKLRGKDGSGRAVHGNSDTVRP